MIKNSFFGLLSFAAVIIAILIYFFFNNHKVDGKPWEMIPNNAAIIFEVDNPANSYHKFLDNNKLWSELLKIKSVSSFNKDIKNIDTLFVNQKSYRKLFLKSNLTIALFPDSTGSIETLALSKIENHINIDDFKIVLSKNLGRKFAVLDDGQLPNGFKIVSAISGVTSYYVFIDGVFVYSSSIDLIEKLIKTYQGKLPKLSENKYLSKLIKSSVSKVPARVFINYRQSETMLKSLSLPKYENAVNWIGRFADWTEVDVILKKDEIVCSGFTLSGNSTSFLNKLYDQNPVKVSALTILPYNVVTFTWLGLSNFKGYFAACKNKKQVDAISSKLNIDINRFVDVVDKEVVFATNALNETALPNNSWVVVSTIDSKNASIILSKIAKNTRSNYFKKYNTYSIRKINNSSFLSDVFGNAFSIITKNYYTFIEDYVVFANSEKSLISLIDYYETGKTLDLSDNFKALSKNISSKSNLLFYINPHNFLGNSSRYFTNQFVNDIEINKDVISSFNGVVLQLVASNDLSFTNFYAKYGSVRHDENLALWKVQFDDDIVWGPFLVRDHSSKTKNIIVFDKYNNMYLVDSDGNRRWKKTIDAVPISEVFEVDRYKNGKIQYLFNTKGYIYLIDRNGNDVSGFPKKMHSNATNGLSVFDYLNNRDYRIFVARSDKRVYNYSITGKEVKGWKNPRMQNIVVEPVTRLLANKKDYIIISDIGNEVKIVNRKGNRRIKIKGNLNKAKYSGYYVNRTNSKGIIITTNKAGKLVYISASGKLSTTDFGDFSPEHFFLYEDFNGDKSKDFIFIDGDKLKVFDRFKKELFSYSFNSNITVAPAVFSFGKSSHVLGVVATEEKSIYLFDNKGGIAISKGLVGETQFTVGSINNDRKINLISAAGNTLYNYRMK